MEPQRRERYLAHTGCGFSSVAPSPILATESVANVRQPVPGAKAIETHAADVRPITGSSYRKMEPVAGAIQFTRLSYEGAGFNMSVRVTNRNQSPDFALPEKPDYIRNITKCRET